MPDSSTRCGSTWCPCCWVTVSGCSSITASTRSSWNEPRSSRPPAPLTSGFASHGRKRGSSFLRLLAGVSRPWTAFVRIQPTTAQRRRPAPGRESLRPRPGRRSPPHRSCPYAQPTSCLVKIREFVGAHLRALCPPTHRSACSVAGARRECAAPARGADPRRERPFSHLHPGVVHQRPHIHRGVLGIRDARGRLSRALQGLAFDQVVASQGLPDGRIHVNDQQVTSCPPPTRRRPPALGASTGRSERATGTRHLGRK